MRILILRVRILINFSDPGQLGSSGTVSTSAFFDENARIILDPEHSDEEDRFVLLGLSVRLRLLVVVHCYRQAEDLIRIISARKAEPSERKQYSDFLR